RYLRGGHDRVLEEAARIPDRRGIRQLAAADAADGFGDLRGRGRCDAHRDEFIADAGVIQLQWRLARQREFHRSDHEALRLALEHAVAIGERAGGGVHPPQRTRCALERFHRMDADACAFAYRDSAFKREPERFVVTAVEFALPRQAPLKLDYAGVGDELVTMGVAHPTPALVAEAVCRIRRRKLPDPAVIGNAGSFFKNPIVPVAVADALAALHPRLPVFAAGNGLRKLSAAWLIDSTGLRGYRDGDAGVSDAHALVLVNHGSATGADLLRVARYVAERVAERHGVSLEPEPRVIGAVWAS
ncbi:MAG TPA: hypothetical protein VIG54_07745, partial [Lysobacter sp.]